MWHLAILTEDYRRKIRDLRLSLSLALAFATAGWVAWGYSTIQHQETYKQLEELKSGQN